MLNRMAPIGAKEALDRKPIVHDTAGTHSLMPDKCRVAGPAGQTEETQS